MPDLVPIVLAAPDLMTALEMNVAIQQSCMVWGPPGIGKSEIMAQLARKLGISLKDVRAMLMNPVDVNGLPHNRYGHEAAMKIHRLGQILATDVIDLSAVREIIGQSSPEVKVEQINKLIADGRGKFNDWGKIREIVGDAADDYFGESIWARPGILPKVGSGILFFDEINAAGPDVQAALYQPVLDRRIGDHLLGLGWVIMAAGNRQNDKGRVQPMPTPLADRLQHYDMAVEFEPWANWANDNDVHPVVIAYLHMSMRKDYPGEGCGMLHRFNPKDRSFPTPRSWVKVSHAIKAMEDRDLIGSPIELATIAGKVGRDAAVEMLDFARTFREGLSLDAIMMNPDTTIIPTQSAMRCAVAAALARNSSKDNIDRVWVYISRLDEEFQTLYMKHATRLHPELTTTRTFTNYAHANQDILR